MSQTVLHIKSYKGPKKALTFDQEISSIRGFDIKLRIHREFDGIPPYAQRVICFRGGLSVVCEMDDDEDISNLPKSSETTPWIFVLKCSPLFSTPRLWIDPGDIFSFYIDLSIIQEEIDSLHHKNDIFEFEYAVPGGGTPPKCMDIFVRLHGPEGTPYAGGSFRVQIQLTASPYPGVQFLTPIWNTYVTPQGEALGQDIRDKPTLWCQILLQTLYHNLQKPPKPSHHESWDGGRGWNEEVYASWVEDPIKFQKKAKDWTTWFARGIWEPSIYPSLPEPFKNDIKLLLLINIRLKGTNLYLPRDSLFLIIKHLLQDRTLLSSEGTLDPL